MTQRRLFHAHLDRTPRRRPSFFSQNRNSPPLNSAKAPNQAHQMEHSRPLVEGGAARRWRLTKAGRNREEEGAQSRTARGGGAGGLGFVASFIYLAAELLAAGRFLRGAAH